MWNTYHRFLPSLVKTMLIVLGMIAGGIIAGILIGAVIDLIQAGELTIDVVYVFLFLSPAVFFGFTYHRFCERITGHPYKFILHDHTIGYHLNRPFIYTDFEVIGYVFVTAAVVLLHRPSLWPSIVFFVVSVAYFAIRLIYCLKPAYEERAANEQKIAADEARKAYEATLIPQPPPNLVPLLTLATQGLISQKNVIIGMAQDSLPIYYREEPRNEEQFKHTLIIAASGHGKTTCETNLATQHIHHGNGVIVLAAESDLFKKLLQYIPEERADDLIYFEPEDITSPVIGFNPFTLTPGENLNQKIGETRTILKRAMGNDLGVSMVPMIDNVVSVLVRKPDATFADLMQLLDPANKTIRASLKTDSTLNQKERDFWKQYDETTYYRQSYGPVYNRFSRFAESPIDTVLAVSSFSFKTMMNKGRYIIFLDLSQLRDKTLVTMGQLLLASIEQALLSRNNIDDPIPYYLYIDEFQKYAEDSKETFVQLYNGARKFKLGVTLAHQSMANIPTELMDTITDNVGTTIALHLSAKSAPFFAKQMQLVSPTLLQNLKPGQGYVQSPTHNIGIPITIPLDPIVPMPKPVPDLKSRSKENFGSEPPSELPGEPNNQPDPPKPPVPQKKKSFGITFE